MTQVTVTTAAVAALAENIQYQVDGYTRRLEDWGKKFANNPAHALEWSNSTFELAAQHSVLSRLLAYVTRKEGEQPTAQEQVDMCAYIIKEAQEQTLRAARRVPQSTSPVSNLMEQYVGSAWADLAEGSILGSGLGRQLKKIVEAGPVE